nr:hypothetical protein [Tanacetum cinerariifolium]
MVDNDDDETSKDKEIDKLMALISLSLSQRKDAIVKQQEAGIQLNAEQADWKDDIDDESDDQE